LLSVAAPSCIAGFIRGVQSQVKRSLMPDPVSRDEAQQIKTLALLALALVAVAFMVVLSPPRPASAASDGYSYFPTADRLDGKMLCIAGEGIQTLAGCTVTVSFSIPSTMTTFSVGVFDGYSHSTWDYSQTNAFDTSFTVYADAQGDGGGTTKCAEWIDTQMNADAWSDFSVNNTMGALTPSGRCFYYMRATARNRAQATYNAFKFRVAGTTYITPLNTFGVIGAPSVTGTANYDGIWDFYVRIPQGSTHFDLWDGDLDRIDDTNDLNTPATIPTWTTNPPAAPEGANPGNPADDIANAYLRTPNVEYTVYMPDGTPYYNGNPSGNSEWELFRLDTAATDTAVMDYHVPSIPAGMWRIHLNGLDQHNLSAFRFENPILGVDASGTPVEPYLPIAISGKVWLDANRDQTQTAGETSITGAILTLRDGAGSFITTTSVDASGTYRFTSTPGIYTIDASDPANYVSGGPLAGLVLTTRRVLTVVLTDHNSTGNDFGFAGGPALVVTKQRTSPDTTIVAGEVASYTVTVRNVGLTTATAVTVTDTIQSDMAYVTGSTVATWPATTSTADPAGGTGPNLRWTFGGNMSLVPSATLTLKFGVRALAGGPFGAHADVVAAAALDTSGAPVAPDCSKYIAADTDPLDAASATVAVTHPGASIAKSLAPGQDTTVGVGSPVSYQVVLTNSGDTTITQASVVDSWDPAYLGWASSSPAPDHLGSGVATWLAALTPIAPGAAATLTLDFTGVALPPGNKTVNRVRGTGIADIDGHVAGDVSSQATIAIVNTKVLVTKTLTSVDPTIQVGQDATFTIVVKNTGDTTLTNVPLEDTFDEEHLSLVKATPSPSSAPSMLTTYAVSTSDTPSTFSSDSSSTGAPDGLVATSNSPPFEMWQGFAMPGDWDQVTGATVTVRSRAEGGWGASTVQTQSDTHAATGDNNTSWSVNTGTRWQAVNSLDGDTTYVYSTAATTRQRFNFTAFTVPAAATNIAVSVVYVAREPVAGVNQITGSLRMGGTNYEGGTGTYDPTTAYTSYTTTWTTDPSTGGAWTVAQANTAIQAFGVYQGTRANQVNVTYCYVKVTYSTTVVNNDTWAIQYSTNAGASWSNIVAPSTSTEGALTDHVLNLAGILTTSNAANFRVRMIGAVVGVADGTGTVDWDASTLDLAYTTPPKGSVLSWSNLGRLNPGQQTTVTVRFRATGVPPGNTTVDTATVSNATDVNGRHTSSVAAASVAITNPNAAISKDLAPGQDATIGVGVPASFRILLTNTGDTTITQASVVDTWNPSYLAWASASPSPNTSSSSGVATWTSLPPIGPGRVGTVTVGYTSITTPPAGYTVNRVRAIQLRDENGDPIGDVSSQATIGIANPRVSVTKTLTSSDATIQAGQDATFTIVLKNTGESRLTTVPLTDNFDPASLTFSTASVTPSSTGAGFATWNNLGALDVGQQMTVTVRLTAVAAPPGATSVDTATVSGATDLWFVDAPTVVATAAVAITRPSVSITKILHQGQDTTVQAGQPVVFDIGVHNNGDTWVTGASVIDTWDPAYLGWVGAAPTSPDSTAPAGTATWTNVAPLPPGGSTTLTVSYTALAAPVGNLTVNQAHTAAVIDINADPIPNDTSTASIAITRPQLSITKTLGPSQDTTVQVGHPVAFRYVLRNTGDTTISSASIVDTWDATYLGWASASPSPNTSASGVATWTSLVPLAPGAATTVTTTFTAVAVPAGNVTTNRVRASGALDVNGDPVPTASSSAAVAITNPQMSVTKTLAPSQDTTVQVGQPVAFRFVLRNTGDTTIASASVVDTWDATLLGWASASPAAAATSSGIATWTALTPLAPGQQATVTTTFTAVAVPAGNITVNRVRASGALDVNGDPVPTASSAATIAISGPGISITKILHAGQETTVQAGSPVVFDIGVHNTGDTPIKLASVVDTWNAAYLDWSSASPSADASSPGAATWTNVAPLAVGGSTTITVTFTAKAPPPGWETTNHVRTAAVVDVNDDNVTDSSSSASIAITNPHVTILKELSPSQDTTVQVGEDVSFRIVVTNSGDTTLTSVPLTDDFEPGYLRFTSAAPSPDGTSSGNLTWSLGDLGPGQQTTVTVVFRAIASPPGYASTDTATAGPATDIFGDTAPAVTCPASIKIGGTAAITALWGTDALSVGVTVSVDCTLTNYATRPITNSTATYLIWWDTDSDGVFDAGDTWVDAAGDPHVYATGEPTTHVTTGIDVAGPGSWEEVEPWTINNRRFPFYGSYKITLTWTTADGFLIDRKTTTFLSIATLGMWLLGLMSALGAAWMWLARGSIAQSVSVLARRPR
jgi:uncharacterized repeat protein (TIGR01451 family)